jgi:hypothetical protein
MECGRIGIHPDGCPGIRHGLRPSKTRTRGSPVLIIEHLVVEHAIQHDKATQQRRNDIGMNFITPGTVRVADVTNESIMVGGSVNRQCDCARQN